jgi:hypothetical protein
MSVTPSAPPDASGTVRGLVNLVAQTFAGAKTFVATIIASAGIQVASLFNTNGTGASDVGVKVGVSTADGSVNATAKLLSARTGIGGTEVEKFFVDAQGNIVGGSGSTNSAQRLLSTQRAASAFEFSQGVGLQTPAFLIRQVSGGKSMALVVGTGGTLIAFDSTAAFSIGPEARTQHDSGVPGNAPTLAFQVTGASGINMRGTDSTGSPGNATIDKPIGKSAIAAGVSTVRITNALVTAASHVIITPHARDATCKEVTATPGAGFFDVSGTANATAALPFSWEVKGII